VDGVSQGDLSLDPRAELAPGKTLGGLRCTVVEYPHHNNGVGMNIQSQFARKRKIRWISPEPFYANDNLICDFSAEIN